MQQILGGGSGSSGTGGGLLVGLLELEAGRRGTVAATLGRADTDDVGVDGARHTVLRLHVQLGDGVFGVDRGLGQVTHSRRLDHVADDEALDGLVFGNTTGTVQATHRVDVSTTRLGASSVSSLRSLHFGIVSTLSLGKVWWRA